VGVKRSPRKDQPKVSFASGDHVLRYVDGQPFFCTVVDIESDERVRVACDLWPTGYSAIVKARDVALVSLHGTYAG
jgi:hypothetical protein